MTAISGPSAALAASLRSSAQPPLYSNLPAARSVSDIVSNALGSNSTQDPIGAIAASAVETPSYETNAVAALAIVVAGTTGSSVSLTDLIDSSNSSAVKFSNEQKEPLNNERLNFISETEASTPAEEPQPVVAETATSDNNNGSNTSTVSTTASYNAASGAYSAAASLTLSAAASSLNISA